MSTEDDRSLSEFVNTIMKEMDDLRRRIEQLEREDVKITRFTSYIEIPEYATNDIPATPSPGFARIYVKTDGVVYKKNDSGSEAALG